MLESQAALDALQELASFDAKARSPRDLVGSSITFKFGIHVGEMLARGLTVEDISRAVAAIGVILRATGKEPPCR